MKKELKIILAEDDEGHASLIKRNLKRAGLMNEIIHFKDGQETLDFLFQGKKDKDEIKNVASLLLLDIKMPRVDGIDVLRKVKQDEFLKKMPVVMITTTDDPREIDKCHELGCSNYITKPIDYDKFVAAIRQLGLFLLIVEVPDLNNMI
ncbi:Response regulator receiver domain-containing protein [Tangfeifania diversioriginum]|uniref:Response regulator receiver domain-containing protein n=1 Tax=Tangfeifania diversioriginum TaxID=1168035 RepID=A0A1M6NQW9_9BACT|nr:response regulator [Tangfeifania diversioriginum]SHJ97962.1 Response regulator receiver domain-containing protein [Tangfeifania diversioriginum]